MPVPSLRHNRITFVAARSIMAQALGIEFPSTYATDFEQPIYTFSGGAVLFLVKESGKSSHAGNRSVKEPYSRLLDIPPYNITPVDRDIPYGSTTLARYNTQKDLAAFIPDPESYFDVGQPLQSMPNQCRTDSSWWNVTATGAGDNTWIWDNTRWVWNYITPTRAGSVSSEFNPNTNLEWDGFRPDLLLITTTRFPTTGQYIRITHIDTPLGNMSSGSIGAHTTLTDTTIVYDVPLNPGAHLGDDFDVFTIYHDSTGETPLCVESISFEFTPINPAPPPGTMKYPNMMMESSLTWCIVGYGEDREDAKDAFLFLMSRIDAISDDITVTFEKDNNMTIRSTNPPEPFPNPEVLDPPVPTAGS